MILLKNLIGQIFGRLTVIEIDSNSKNKKWICKCTCGNTKSILEHSLLYGLTKSCGCLRKENARKACLKDISDQKFGKLTVI